MDQKAGNWTELLAMEIPLLQVEESTVAQIFQLLEEVLFRPCLPLEEELDQGEVVASF